ncbi:MAG: hypothetical protein GVY04_04980 [Cyanobacteria bacterium]|jgi:hypothetical protein|nr:hypothetical protein [Cyanobacteria bacterium GSL.Bin1]
MDEQHIPENVGWQDDAINTGSDTVERDLLDANDQVRPNEVQDKPPLQRRPLPRLFFVLGGVSIITFLFWQLTAGNFTASKSNQNQPSSADTEQEKREKGEIAKLKEENAKLKEDLAFAGQAEMIEEKPSPKKTTSQSEPDPQSNSEPPDPITNSSKPIASTPPEPAPQPKPTPAPPKPAPQPKPTNNFSPKPSPEPEVSPREQWLQASQVGSYGNLQTPSPSTATNSGKQAPTSTIASQPKQLINASDVSGGTGSPPKPISGQNETLTSASKKNAIQEGLPSPEGALPGRQAKQTQQPASQTVTIGTQVTGELETSIAWAENQTTPNRKFLLRLTQPLKGENNTVVLPEDTRLVGQVSQVSNSGLLKMKIVSAIQEDGTQRNLPTQAILVLGEDGRPLRAEVESPNTGSNDLAAMLLAGVSQAAEIANEADEEFSFESEGGSFSRSSNNDANYLAGAVQGATQEMLERMNRRNEQALEQVQGQEKLFVLEQGTEVQLFVNESISM